jgi:uncharacterized membrane protein YbhN (UPF0104 family)
LRWSGALVAVGLLLAASALTATCFSDLGTVLRVLAGGRWAWIAAAIAIHFLYFLVYVVLYRLGFAVVGISSRTWALLPVMFAGLFVNLIVPTGAGGAAVLVDDAVRRGESAARAAVGVVLVLLLDLVTVVPFIAWAMTFVVHEHMFATWQLLAATAYVLYLVLLVALLALSRARQAAVCRVLAWCYRGLHRVLGWIRVRGPAPDWPERTAAGLADAATAIVANPGRLALAGLSGIALHVVNAFGLWLCVRGFGADVPVGGLVAAFAFGIVLHVIAVIPQLAPLAQAFMTATFIRVGMAAGPAVAAPLAFRGLMLALPIVLGMPFAWRIGRARAATRAWSAPDRARGRRPSPSRRTARPGAGARDLQPAAPRIHRAA